MNPKIKFVKRRVEQLLHDIPATRDDDLRLHFELARMSGIDPDVMTVREFFTAQKNGTVPSYRTTVRCRNWVQSYTPAFRGTLWSKRHAKGESVRQEAREHALVDSTGSRTYPPVEAAL